MSEQFISKEVFDAEVKRQAAEYEKRVAKLEAAFQLQRVKNKKDIEALQQCVNDANRRGDDIKDFVTWGFASLGFGVTVLGIIIAALQFFK